MIDLRPTGIAWHTAAGRPVVIYADIGGALRIPIGVGAEDARLLVATMDDADSSPRRRLFRLLGATLVALGARLVEVSLRFQTEDVFEARLRIDGPRGEATLTAPAVDGLILARWAALPVRVAADDLARLREWAEAPAPGAPGRSDPPAAFRAALDAPGGDRPEGGAASPPGEEEAR
jgi:bifunctional DNase/RNase